jgi:hypothetical protein
MLERRLLVSAIAVDRSSVLSKSASAFLFRSVPFLLAF